MQTTSVTEIHQILTPRTIRVDLPGETKQEVVDSVIDLLRDHAAVRDLEGVREAVFSREKVMSTGVGKGLGLPHAKSHAVSDTVAAFAVTREPVEFDSIDNAPVRLIFLLVGTDAAKSQHIKLLSRISRLMNRDAFRERLLKAHSPEEVLSLFEEGESELFEA
jgi:fructose-specific phosphotransferase system IIA component